MKIFAFILGVLFGIVAVFGAVFVAVATVTPDTLTGGTASETLGDIGKLSFMSIFNKVRDAFSTQGKFYRYKTDADGNIALDDNGKKIIEECAAGEGEYFSLSMFCATTGLDLDKVFGTTIPDSVYKIPVAEYFNSENGVNNAFKQIKVSALTEIINLFGKTDDGNKKIDQATVDKLDGFSLFDLVGENGIETVFADIKLAELVSDVFPAEKTDDNKLLYALGQSLLGKTMTAFKANKLFFELKAGGSLEETGKLKVTEVVTASEEINNIFGDTTIADLVNDNGELDVNKLMETTKLGNIMGYKYDAEKGEWYTTDDSGSIVYAEGIVASVAGLTVKEVMNTESLYDIRVGELVGYKRTESATDGYTSYAATTDVMTDGSGYIKADGDKWYKAKLTCSNSGHTDVTHTSDCFDYVWNKDSAETSGIIGSMASLTVRELSNGDKINAKIESLTLGDVLNITEGQKPLWALRNTKIGKLGEGINEITLGDVITIDETSNKLLRRLAGEKVGSLGTVADNLVLGDVIDVTTDSPKILVTLKDKKINELGNAVETLKLSDVIDTDGNAILAALADSNINDLGTDINNVKMGTVMNYQYVENCTESGHSTTAHWHESATDKTEIVGVYGKIANMTIAEISEKDASGNSGIERIMAGLTIGDLVNSNIMDIGEGDTRTQNEYKLRILTCVNPSAHSITHNGNTFQCNIEGYYTYRAALSVTGSDCTAQQFFNLTHDTDAEKAECMDFWQSVPVSDFMSALLSGI